MNNIALVQAGNGATQMDHSKGIQRPGGSLGSCQGRNGVRAHVWGSEDSVDADARM